MVRIHPPVPNKKEREMKNIKDLKSYLKDEMSACDSAGLKWAGNKDLKTAFKECNRIDWWLWYLDVKTGCEGYPNRKELTGLFFKSCKNLFEYLPESDHKDIKDLHACIKKWVKEKGRTRKIKKLYNTVGEITYEDRTIDASIGVLWEIGDVIIYKDSLCVELSNRGRLKEEQKIICNNLRKELIKAGYGVK